MRVSERKSDRLWGTFMWPTFLSVIGNKTSSPSKRSGGRHSKLAQRELYPQGTICRWRNLQFPVQRSAQQSSFSNHCLTRRTNRLLYACSPSLECGVAVVDIFVFPLKTRHVVEKTFGFYIKIPSLFFSEYIYIFSFLLMSLNLKQVSNVWNQSMM